MDKVSICTRKTKSQIHPFGRYPNYAKAFGSRRRFGVKKDCELVAIRTMRKRSVRVVVLVSKQIVKEHTGGEHIIGNDLSE